MNVVADETEGVIPGLDGSDGNFFREERAGGGGKVMEGKRCW